MLLSVVLASTTPPQAGQSTFQDNSKSPIRAACRKAASACSSSTPVLAAKARTLMRQRSRSEPDSISRSIAAAAAGSAACRSRVYIALLSFMGEPGAGSRLPFIWGLNRPFASPNGTATAPRARCPGASPAVPQRASADLEPNRRLNVRSPGHHPCPAEAPRGERDARPSNRLPPRPGAVDDLCRSYFRQSRPLLHLSRAGLLDGGRDLRLSFRCLFGAALSQAHRRGGLRCRPAPGIPPRSANLSRLSGGRGRHHRDLARKRLRLRRRL